MSRGQDARSLGSSVLVSAGADSYSDTHRSVQGDEPVVECVVERPDYEMTDEDREKKFNELER